MPIVAQSTETTDCVSRYADEVVAEWERRVEAGTSTAVITVASGLSPSGPIHLRPTDGGRGQLYVKPSATATLTTNHCGHSHQIESLRDRRIHRYPQPFTVRPVSFLVGAVYGPSTNTSYGLPFMPACGPISTVTVVSAKLCSSRIDPAGASNRCASTERGNGRR